LIADLSFTLTLGDRPLFASRRFISFRAFKETAAPALSTLSLHDALPIFRYRLRGDIAAGAGPVLDHHLPAPAVGELLPERARQEDRKSTRLNSSHQIISYAVFCLKKKRIARTSSLHPPEAA